MDLIMMIKRKLFNPLYGLLLASSFCSAGAFNVPTPFVQRTPPKGFILNDLSFYSRGMYDFMSWEQAGKLGDKESLFVGGKVAVDAQGWKVDDDFLDAQGAIVNSGSTAFLQNARLILTGKISEGASFAYGRAFRMNRNLFAFATLSPPGSNWMLSGGNMVLPFGNLSGAVAPWTFELSMAAYQVQENGVMLAYRNDATRYSATVFRPNSAVQGSLSDFIIDGEHDFSTSNGMTVTLGGSYLNDIRGINRNINGSVINGMLGRQWTVANSNEGRIGAYDLRAQLSFNNFKVLGEWISNTRNSTVTDNKAARLQTVSVSYDGIQAFNMSHRVFASWNHTQNMSNIPLTPGGFLSADTPIKTQWLAGVSTYVYSNTKVSFEALYSENYANKGYLNGTLDLSVYF